VTRDYTRGAAAGVAALGLLAVAAVAGQAILRPDAPAPAAPATARPTLEVPFPTGEPSFDLQQPLTVTEVGPGRPVTLDGSGPRQVAFTVADAPAPVVAALDCRLCTGLLTWVAGEFPEPLFAGTGPYAGERLVATGGAGRALLRVEAVGRWRLRLTASADLDAAASAVSGEGARVVALAGPGTGADLRPAGRLVAYAAASGARLGAGDGRLDVGLPALVEVDAPGPWTLTPRR